MGLTIHYSLKSDTRSAKEARRLMEELHRCAATLPFKEVGPVLEITGDACAFEGQPDDELRRWLLIQAAGDVQQGKYSYSVTPTHVIAFSTLPGDGCESANFGLCRYPATIEVADHDVWPVGKRKIRTSLSGWRWSSFCKTEYASNPECGGIPNFLRSHLLVVRMLDRCRELGLLTEVRDEGDFWMKRDPQALVKEVGEWNEMIAGLAGKMKDLVGPELQAAIFAFPDFEHLEAKGRKGGK